MLDLSWSKNTKRMQSGYCREHKKSRVLGAGFFWVFKKP